MRANPKGAGGGKTQPLKVNNQQKSRLCTQRWARTENSSSPIAQSYLHSWSPVTECAFRGHNALEATSRHPVSLPRGIHPSRLTLGLMERSLPVSSRCGMPADAAG